MNHVLNYLKNYKHVDLAVTTFSPPPPLDILFVQIRVSKLLSLSSPLTPIPINDRINCRNLSSSLSGIRTSNYTPAGQTPLREIKLIASSRNRGASETALRDDRPTHPQTPSLHHVHHPRSELNGSNKDAFTPFIPHHHLKGFEKVAVTTYTHYPV